MLHCYCCLHYITKLASPANIQQLFNQVITRGREKERERHSGIDWRLMGCAKSMYMSKDSTQHC